MKYHERFDNTTVQFPHKIDDRSEVQETIDKNDDPIELFESLFRRFDAITLTLHKGTYDVVVDRTDLKQPSEYLDVGDDDGDSWLAEHDEEGFHPGGR